MSSEEVTVTGPVFRLISLSNVLMRSVKTSGGMTRGRGMSESQRSTWLLSMPACADMNNALQELTDVGFHTSDQHKESTLARKERDRKDITSILAFLIDRSPFNAEDSLLRNIDTGVVADKTVNADRAKDVGTEVIQSLAGKTILDFSFKKSNHIVTMSARNGVTVDGDVVQIDPQLLFQRLTKAARGNFEDISEVFKYEICSFPSSLFDESGLPREANKPVLAEAIWSMGDCGVPEVNESDLTYVLDGGSLLQRIPWKTGDSFLSICKTYVEYVRRRYEDVVVVFDGYPQGPSTKDVTHIRRTKGAVQQMVNFTEGMPCKMKKQVFLANATNKQKFINLLSQTLRESGCTTNHAEEDADKLIVTTTVACSSTKTVVLIGEDTDLLVLLCYHADTHANKLFFRSETSARQSKIWDIQKTKSVLGQDLCRLLPVIHAITGCDTTSRLFGIGKGAALKKIRAHPYYMELAENFLCKDSSVKTLVKSGEEILAFLYGGVIHEGLDLLRFRRFTQKTITSTTNVNVQSLPPTSDSAIFHSKRVFLQCIQWISEDGDVKLDPLEWGWHSSDENCTLRNPICRLPRNNC